MKRKSGWKIIWMIFALPLAAFAVSATPHDFPAMAEKVTKAVPTDELIVVVHQMTELVAPTISLLDEPRYADSPRVMLTDGANYPLTPSLVARATLVQYSLHGELSLNVDAKTVTLLGGSVNDCLRRSGQSLIAEILDHQGRPKLTLRIPSRAAWGWKHVAGGLTLNDSFCRGNPTEFDSKVKEFAETFIEEGDFPGDFSLTRSYRTEPGREGGMDYGFVFTRKSDGKQIDLIIEQLCNV